MGSEMFYVAFKPMQEVPTFLSWRSNKIIRIVFRFTIWHPKRCSKPPWLIPSWSPRPPPPHSLSISSSEHHVLWKSYVSDGISDLVRGRKGCCSCEGKHKRSVGRVLFLLDCTLVRIQPLAQRVSERMTCCFKFLITTIGWNEGKYTCTVQGDHSGCSPGVVDIKAVVSV